MSEEDREDLINQCKSPVVADMLIDYFSVEEVDGLYMTARTKLSGVAFRNIELWVADFIQYYFNILMATKKETKSTPYRRLLNYLRKDYENYAEVLNNKYAQDK